MIKNTDTLMVYSFEKDGEKDELYVTINNDKNEDNSLYASAFEKDFTLVSAVKSSDRNQIGYALMENLKELGYDMIEFRISRKSEILVELMLRKH